MIAKIIHPRIKRRRTPRARNWIKYFLLRAFGTRTICIAGSIEDAAGQMLATCLHHCQNPANAFVHMILSWRKGEEPTDAQIFAAADHALASLGAEGHEAAMGIHRDTGQDHIHIVFSRVNPLTGKCSSLWQDYRILEKACREIEAHQGWQADRGRFDAHLYMDGTYPIATLVPRPELSWIAKKIRRQTGQAVRNIDYASGRSTGMLPLHLRIPTAILARIGKVAEASATWDRLHTDLRRFGLTYQMERHGGTIGVAETTQRVAASHVHPSLSARKLIQRLGVFVADVTRAPMKSPPKPETIITGEMAAIAGGLKHALTRLLEHGRLKFHEALLTNPKIVREITGIVFDGPRSRVNFRRGGWVYSDATRIELGSGGPQKITSYVAMLLAQSLGWARIKIAGSLPDELKSAATGCGLGIAVGTGLAAPIQEAKLKPFGKTVPSLQFMHTRTERVAYNRGIRREARNARLQTTERRRAILDETVFSSENVPEQRRQLIRAILRMSLECEKHPTSAFLKNILPLPTLNYHSQTGRLLDGIRWQQVDLSRSDLDFSLIKDWLRRVADRKDVGVVADLLKVSPTLILLAHHTLSGEICGFEYATGDRLEHGGMISGSETGFGFLPSAGDNIERIKLVENLQTALNEFDEAFGDGVTLISKGVYKDLRLTPEPQDQTKAKKITTETDPENPSLNWPG